MMINDKLENALKREQASLRLLLQTAIPDALLSANTREFTTDNGVKVAIKEFLSGTLPKDPSKRNEALDCRVYARAAAWIAGADRWPDEKWRDLEDQLGAAPTDTDPAGQINRPGQAPQGKRRSDWLGRRGGWF